MIVLPPSQCQYFLQVCIVLVLFCRFNCVDLIQAIGGGKTYVFNHLFIYLFIYLLPAGSLTPALDSQCRLGITLVALLPLELWIWTGKRSENPVSVLFPPCRVFFVLISHPGQAWEQLSAESQAVPFRTWGTRHLNGGLAWHHWWEKDASLMNLQVGQQAHWHPSNLY